VIGLNFSPWDPNIPLSLFSGFVQDRVPAFSPEKAKAFIEKEMGCSIDVVYKEFEERPIAAASLGQVFTPKLYQYLHFSTQYHCILSILKGIPFL
jgi:hypothetical protein